MLSVILEELFRAFTLDEVPYGIRRSDASRTPSLQTIPIVGRLGSALFTS